MDAVYALLLEAHNVVLQLRNWRGHIVVLCSCRVPWWAAVVTARSLQCLVRFGVTQLCLRIGHGTCCKRHHWPRATPAPTLCIANCTDDTNTSDSAAGHVEVLQQAMRDAEVDGALIIQPGNHSYDHSYVTSVLRAHPDQFVGALLANPTTVRLAGGFAGLVHLARALLRSAMKHKSCCRQ
jgi:hypothetical protein